MGNEDTCRNGNDNHNLPRNGERYEVVGEVHHRENFDRAFPKAIKLDFPRFSSKNPATWVYRIQQYFLYHQLPPGQRIFFASFHMDDDALVWFQGASDEGVFTY